MNVMQWPKKRPKNPKLEVLNMLSNLQSHIRLQIDKYKMAREHRYTGDLREIQSRLSEIAETINEHRLL